MNTTHKQDQKKNQTQKTRRQQGSRKQGLRKRQQTPQVLHEHELIETRMFR